MCQRASEAKREKKKAKGQGKAGAKSKGKGKGKGKGKSKKRKRSETEPCEDKEDHDDGDVTMEAVAGDVNSVNFVNSEAALESDQLEPPAPSDRETVPAHDGADLPVVPTSEGGGQLIDSPPYSPSPPPPDAVPEAELPVEPIEAAAEPEPSDPGLAPEAVPLEAERRVEPPEAPHPPEPEPAAEAARPVAGPRVVGPRIHSTPALLKSIEPMDWFKLRLDKNAHRFQVEMDKKKTVQHRLWDAKHRQMYYSNTFKKKSWQDALSQVHEWMWEKAILAGLDTSEPAQVPGQVPVQVLDGLKHEMDSLPAPKDYAKR